MSCLLVPRKSGDETTECREPPLGENFEITVLYQDAQIVVVDKPYDIRVDGDFPITVEKLVRKKIAMDKFRLCNQLDYATSGVLVIGMSKSGARNCNKLFSERRTSKWYLAVGNGALLANHVLGEEIRITENIFEPEGDFRMTIDPEKGLEAESVLIPVKSGLVLHHQEKIPIVGTLFLVKLITGRRHQIRLHMRHAGYAVLGDATYGDGDRPLCRMMLHAWKLKLPFDRQGGQEVIVTAPIPVEFQCGEAKELLEKYI
jgi:23S rRNA-/tRNA-specific pseudouridylate synthase